MPRKTKKTYEEYLNGFDDTIGLAEYQPKAANLIYSHKFGTALRKYDPIAFEVGYQEWEKVNYA